MVKIIIPLFVQPTVLFFLLLTSPVAGQTLTASSMFGLTTRDHADAIEIVSKSKYQEAVWLLDSKGYQQEANLLRNYLKHLLQQSVLTEVVDMPGLPGATKPIIVNLSCRLKGVFKKKSKHPSSNYKAEVAAYMIDELYKFNLVPMTIVKKIKNKIGSLQYYIEEAVPAQTQIGYIKSNRLNIFDYIISNKDRNIGNVLLLHDREIAIDHGLSLEKNNSLGSFLNNLDILKKNIRYKVDPIRSLHFSIKDFPALYDDKEIYSNLKKATLNQLHYHLEGFLSKSQIRKVYQRIRKYLARMKVYYNGD